MSETHISLHLKHFQASAKKKFAENLNVLIFGRSKISCKTSRNLTFSQKTHIFSTDQPTINPKINISLFAGHISHNCTFSEQIFLFFILPHWIYGRPSRREARRKICCEWNFWQLTIPPCRAVTWSAPIHHPTSQRHSSAHFHSPPNFWG